MNNKLKKNIKISLFVFVLVFFVGFIKISFVQANATNFGELVSKWRELREKLHDDEDKDIATQEQQDIEDKMAKIREEAVYYSEEYCGGQIYFGDGTDGGFHHYNPDSFHGSGKSALVLCVNSPRMISCEGFNKHPLLDKGREVFRDGNPTPGPITIVCTSQDYETYEFYIPDGSKYYPPPITDACEI